MREAGQEPRRRVLVVSTDADLVAAAQELPRHGYDVVRFPDGAAAVAEARARPPAAMVLDADELGSALGVLDALRGDGPDPWVPVVLAASVLTAEAVNEGLRRGAHDYLRKPVDRV